MNNHFNIFWKDTEVGRIENVISDMWYIDGKWVSNGSKLSENFENLIITFDPKIIFQNPAQGTRVVLKVSDKDLQTYALVLGLINKNLSLKLIVQNESIQWLIKNVKE